MPRSPRKSGKIRAVCTTQSRPRTLAFTRPQKYWQPWDRCWAAMSLCRRVQMLFEEKISQYSSFFKKSPKTSHEGLMKRPKNPHSTASNLNSRPQTTTNSFSTRGKRVKKRVPLLQTSSSETPSQTRMLSA